MEEELLDVKLLVDQERDLFIAVCENPSVRAEGKTAPEALAALYPKIMRAMDDEMTRGLHDPRGLGVR